MTRRAALVGVGGALGATARYSVAAALPSLVATFAVNVAGCFALGYLLYSVGFGVFSEEARLFAATGFVSSFTTYSTFALDVFTSRPSVGFVYVVASYAVGFAAVAAGSSVATHRFGRGTP